MAGSAPALDSYEPRRLVAAPGRDVELVAPRLPLVLQNTPDMHCSTCRLCGAVRFLNVLYSVVLNLRTNKKTKKYRCEAYKQRSVSLIKQVPMSLLQPIAGRAHYIPGSNNLGVVVTGDGGAIAIDTGLDKDTGRLIRKALDAARLTLRAIVNTHHHADHIGGNDYLARNVAGLTIYAPRLEAALIEHPVLEPIYLNMGAAPLGALRNKWLMAKGTPVDRIVDGERFVVAGVEFEVIALPGHSIN